MMESVLKCKTVLEQYGTVPVSSSVGSYDHRQGPHQLRNTKDLIIKQRFSWVRPNLLNLCRTVFNVNILWLNQVTSSIRIRSIQPFINQTQRLSNYPNKNALLLIIQTISYNIATLPLYRSESFEKIRKCLCQRRSALLDTGTSLSSVRAKVLRRVELRLGSEFFVSKS